MRLSQEFFKISRIEILAISLCACDKNVIDYVRGAQVSSDKAKLVVPVVTLAADKPLLVSYNSAMGPLPHNFTPIIETGLG